MRGFRVSLAGNQGLDAFAQFAQATGHSAKWTGAELFFNRLQHQLTFKFVGQSDRGVNVVHDKSRACAYSLFSASDAVGVSITAK